MSTKYRWVLFLSLVLFLLINIEIPAVGQSTEATHPQGEKLAGIIKAFDDYARKAMAEWGVPGMAVVVVRGEDILYERALGVREEGRPEPVTPDTVFQIGSATKAFTTTLLGIMVDRGRLSWRDKVVDHLPAFRMYDPHVTADFEVEDLVAQHSGLEGQVLAAMPLVGYGRSDAMAALAKVEPAYGFRARFSYINAIFLWAAALTEKYTDGSWEKALDDLIFQPLEMNRSSATREAYLQAGDAAGLHTRRNEDPDGDLMVLDRSWPFQDWVYVMGPAGSINSSIRDMTHWLIMHLDHGRYNGQTIISRENLEYTYTPKTIVNAGLTGERTYYGLGWVFNTYEPYPIIWHNGSTLGAHSIISFMPEAGIGIVVLTNMRGNLVPEALAKRFYDLYFDKPFKDWNAELLKGARENKEKRPVPLDDPAPGLDLEEYVGIYENRVYGRIELIREGEKLGLVIGPAKMKMILTHWNRDVFMASVPEFMDFAEWVRFEVGPDGDVDGVVVDFLNSGRAGRFKRVEE